MSFYKMFHARSCSGCGKVFLPGTKPGDSDIFCPTCLKDIDDGIPKSPVKWSETFKVTGRHAFKFVKRWPRSKKRRIRNKWKNRFRIVIVPVLPENS